MPANDHLHHVPDNRSLDDIAAIRSKCVELDALIRSVCPEDRNATIALDKLEEVRMWAVASIAKQAPAVALDAHKEKPTHHPTTGMPMELPGGSSVKPE